MCTYLPPQVCTVLSALLSSLIYCTSLCTLVYLLGSICCCDFSGASVFTVYFMPRCLDEDIDCSACLEHAMPHVMVPATEGGNLDAVLEHRVPNEGERLNIKPTNMVQCCTPRPTSMSSENGCCSSTIPESLIKLVRARSR